MSILAPVVFLRRPAGDELHALGYDIAAYVFHQQMDVVGCHHVVQYAETESLLCFGEPMQVPAPIAHFEHSRSSKSPEANFLETTGTGRSGETAGTIETGYCIDVICQT